MHVTVQPSDLAAALKLSVAAGRTTMPVLQHALLSARDGVLEMETTDSEIYVRTRVPAEVQTPGDALLFEPLLRPVAAGEGGIVFTAQRVSRGRSHYQIPRLPPGDFPRPERVQFQPLEGVVATALRQAIAGVAYAADPDDVHVFARAVNVVPGAAWASDGKSLSRVALSYTGPALMIPVWQVPRVLAAMVDGAVVSIGNVRHDRAGMLRIATPDMTTTLALLNGGVPDIRAAFPRQRDDDPGVTLKTSAFIAALRRFLPFTQYKSGHSAALSLARDQLVLADLRDDNREDLTDCVSEITGSFRFGFNPKWMIEALSAIDTDTVRLTKPAAAGNSPAVLVPTGADPDEHIHLLAPQLI